MTNLEKFERYLETKQKFLKDMLLIVNNELAIAEFQIQVDLLDDIIYHFKVIVKDKISDGMGEDG